MSAVARLLVDIPRFTWGYLFEGAARPPAIVWVPALLVAALLLVSPVYLALRTVGAGEDAFDLIFRTRTLWVVARTVALMVAVMLGCIVIAAPLAWLTVRTDLPWRGFWRVATMLPLALPSYIVGFAIAVGLGPPRHPAGVAGSGFGVERIPSIYGFTGAAFTLIIISWPIAASPLPRCHRPVRFSASSQGSSRSSKRRFSIRRRQWRRGSTSTKLLRDLKAM